MGKVLLLLLIILLTLASRAGYLFIAEAIIAGEIEISDGEKQLEKGRPALEAGRHELETGKREYSDGKKEYEEAEDNLFLVLADKLLKNGSGFREARARIAEGKRQITMGAERVSVGEKRFDAGKLKLLQGREQLRLAKYAFVVCVFGTFFFASALIVLGFLWRRSLARTIMRTDTKASN